MKYETLDSKEIKDVIEGRPLKRMSTGKMFDPKKVIPKLRNDDTKGVPDIRGGDKNKL
jgi:hypothetical protein